MRRGYLLLGISILPIVGAIGCAPKLIEGPPAISELSYKQEIHVSNKAYFLNKFMLLHYETKSEIRARMSAENSLVDKPVKCLSVSYEFNDKAIEIAGGLKAVQTSEISIPQENPSLEANEVGLVWTLDHDFNKRGVQIHSVGFC